MNESILKIIIVIVLFLVIVSIVNKITRKILKVEKKKFFSYNHINDQHKKIDWTIRISFAILILIGGVVNATKEYSNRIILLEPHNILFIAIFILEIIRVIFEKKYSENKNDYLFTIIQLVLMSLFLILFFSTNYFGILEDI